MAPVFSRLSLVDASVTPRRGAFGGPELARVPKWPGKKSGGRAEAFASYFGGREECSFKRMMAFE